MHLRKGGEPASQCANIQEALGMESCGVGLHFGGLRWRSKLQEGSDSTLPAWSLPQVRVPKDKVRVALSTAPPLAPRCVGRWQRPLTGSRTLPRSVLHLYLLSSCSPDGFFCDLTYFLLACAPGLISNAGVYRLCLVSIAAMATGASPRREAKIEPLRFVFPGVSEVLQITHPS